MVYFIVTEYVPYFFALDYALMKTYIKNEEDNLLNEKENIIDEKNGANFINMETGSSGDSKSRGRLSKINPTPVTQMLVKSKDINLFQSVYSRKNGLGTLYKATFQGTDVICRVISFDRLSRYDLEGVSKDMEEVM